MDHVNDKNHFRADDGMNHQQPNVVAGHQNFLPSKDMHCEIPDISGLAARNGHLTLNGFLCCAEHLFVGLNKVLQHGLKALRLLLVAVV